VFERKWFNVREPVRDLDPREVPDLGADRKWMLVAIDDGVVPAAIKVWMTATDACRVKVDRLDEVVIDSLRRAVSDLDDPVAQVKALRALSPLQLHPGG
jgi:hypothetical protein